MWMYKKFYMTPNTKYVDLQKAKLGLWKRASVNLSDSTRVETVCEFRFITIMVICGDWEVQWSI